MKVTPHFSVAEFDSHDGTDYPADRVETHLRPLCVALERIREELSQDAGKPVPLAIISGYRSPAHNARVKGAPKSRHVEGDAADVAPMGVSVRALHECALRLHKLGVIRIGGLALYKSWVHIDTRPGDVLARWTGSGMGSEQAA